MEKKNVEIAVGINCVLGECPLWDVESKCLYFVDILDKKVYRYDPAKAAYRAIQAPGMVGALVPTSDGHFLAAVDDGLYTVDLEKEEWQHVLHPESHLPDNRFNDGKCDARGRFWIGSMHVDEEDHAGTLYRIDKDFKSKAMVEGTSISNGLEWNKQQDTFYHIDSPTKSVFAYSFDAASGEVNNARKVIVFEEDEGVPDGMTIDTEGMLWIAHFGGGCVSRRNPATGELLFKIDLPVGQVTSCTFGGTDLSDLYITTAANELSESELQEQPQAGFTYVIRNIGFQGYPPRPFG